MRQSPVPSDMWIPLHVHLQAVQEEREKFIRERDRRYSEVAIEREKALIIKETANQAALNLAREIQTYKDEKANELRSQIEQERGTYATKEDLSALTDKIQATVKPIADFVAGSRGGTVVWGQLAIAVGLILSAVTLYIKL